MKFKMDMGDQAFVNLLMYNIAKSNQRETRRNLQRLADRYARKEEIDIKMEDLTVSIKFLTLVLEKIEDVLAREDLEQELKEVSEKRHKILTRVLDHLIKQVEAKRGTN